MPQSPLDPAAMAGVVANVPVVDGVRTPIAASLQQVASDLGSAPGPKIVVLVTDGEETCGGDPGAVIQALAASGVDVRVNIVGFALDDAALKAQFEQWARLGNGQYIDAADQSQLTAAVAAAVQPTYDVIDGAGTVVATGQAGGAPVSVPAGDYTVVLHAASEQRLPVTISPASSRPSNPEVSRHPVFLYWLWPAGGPKPVQERGDDDTYRCSFGRASLRPMRPVEPLGSVDR